MMRLHLSLAAAWLGTMAACDVIGLGGPTRRTLIVQHHAAECVGVSLQLCLLVRDPRQTAFDFHYSGIEGFEYEWGFVYTIEVEEHPVKNPPADGSSIRTVLRTLVARERVASGLQFDIVLTSGNGRVVEVAPDRYRFYGSAEFTCPADASCAELRAQIGTGARLGFRFEHPATPGAPLTVVRWDLCDAAHANHVFSCRD